MTDNLFSRQVIDNFSYNSGYGYYHRHQYPTPFALVEGQRYLVYWDGLIYESVAYAFTYGIYSVVGIGNTIQAGGEDNGEPYAISYNEEYGTLDYFSTETDTSHTISVTLISATDVPLFSDHRLSFEFSSMFGLYLWETFGNTELYPNPILFPLTADEKYRIVWDGNSYDCIAQTVNTNGLAGTAIGNLGLAGIGENTGEPFVMGIFADGSDTACLTSDEGTTHSVILYHFASRDQSIVLKNYSGVDVTYENVEAVMFDTPDGNTQIYSCGEAIQDVMVELDMLSGNQKIYAPNGTLVKSAVIIKPDTLLPENIRHNINIAGVEGEFIGNTEELAFSLSMADGDMVITSSDESKVISKVTITKPDTLVPENIAEGIEIGGIVGTFVGGSKIEGVYKVRFYSWDGQLLLERYCYHGDDCPCPVAQGRITVSTTRENNSKYMYGEWCGWAKAPDIAAQSEVLNNVTEELTLYAAYEITLENIIPEQTIPFTYSSNDKCYQCEILPGNIVNGETYVVVWDGTPYTLDCKTGAGGVINGSINISATNYLGDPTIRKAFYGYTIAWKVSSTGEPFDIAQNSTNQLIIYTQKTNASHTVWVYK